MKLKLLVVSIIMGLSTQSFALTKNIDFYTNSSNNTNRLTVSGHLSELDKASFSGNTLLIDGLNASSYITLNDKTPYLISFNEQNLNLYEILNKNKGKQIDIGNESYTVIGFTGEYLILTGSSDSKYVFKKIDDTIEIPKEWVIQGQKGLKASFDNPIKESDTLYYSQIENGLSYSNDYQAVIQDDKKINLVHYVNINNGTDKVFDNVNVSFFLSEANVNKRRPEIMYKTMNAMARESADTVEQPSFQASDVAGLKTISLSKPVTIEQNMNKIKHTDKLYDYENYVNFSFQNEFFVYFNTNDNVETYEANYNKTITDLKESLISNKNLFTDMIKIKLDKDDILAAGNIDVYEKSNDNAKLIVSTNLNHNENKDLEIEKNKNRDLKIVDINVIPWNQSDIFKIAVKDSSFKLNVLDISIKNVGKNDYNVIFKGKSYIIKSGNTVKISIN